MQKAESNLSETPTNYMLPKSQPTNILVYPSFQIKVYFQVDNFVKPPLIYFHFAKTKQDRIYRISCDIAVQNFVNVTDIDVWGFFRHIVDQIYIVKYSY